MIREYFEGDLSSGFTGLRVVVSVGGKYKQKWFAESQFAQPTAWRLATELEAKWLTKQTDKQRNNVFSKRSNTGIKGLYFTYDIKEKGDRTYKYPKLFFTYMHHGDITSRSWFLAPDFTLTQSVWEEVCLCIKNTRTLRYLTYEKLRAKKPDSVKHFKKATRSK